MTAATCAHLAIFTAFPEEATHHVISPLAETLDLVQVETTPSDVDPEPAVEREAAEPHSKSRSTSKPLAAAPAHRKKRPAPSEQSSSPKQSSPSKQGTASEAAQVNIPSVDELAHKDAVPEPTAQAFANLGAAVLSLGETEGLAAGGSSGRVPGVGGKARRGNGAGASQTVAVAPAKLLVGAHTCRDLFPHAASSDSATVTLAVSVSPTGTPRHARVLSAFPDGQGFAAAARYCAQRFKFAPAVSSAGDPVSSTSRVQLRFERSRS